jgi:hypothetical protein
MQWIANHIPKSSHTLTVLDITDEVETKSRRTTCVAQWMSRVQAQVQVLLCLVQVWRRYVSPRVSQSTIRAVGALDDDSCLPALADKSLRDGWGREEAINA